MADAPVLIDRAKCVGCGKCVKGCGFGALKIVEAPGANKLGKLAEVEGGKQLLPEAALPVRREARRVLHEHERERAEGEKFEKRHPDLFRGQCLHAAELELTHPATGERMHFEAPLPDNFKRILELINAGAL